MDKPYSKPPRSVGWPHPQMKLKRGQILQVEGETLEVISFEINEDHFEYYNEVKRDLIVKYKGQRQLWKEFVGNLVIEHNLS